MHGAAQFICSVLVLVLWSLANSQVAAIAFCVVFGLFSGTVIGCPPASISHILNCTYTKPELRHLAKKKLGHWTGMMYSFAAIPALTGPVIAGYLISKYNTYLTVQMWSGTNLFISFICMCIARWYLPCEDGEMVRTKLARKFGQMEVLSGLNDPERLSQAPTRVQSQAPSRYPSEEKISSPEAAV